MAKKVVIGMSGGVDSAVAASLLKEQGYDVVALYMSNWKETDENGACTGEEDWADVKRICTILDIPYYSVDFSHEYWESVFAHFVDEYKKGRTPNPDVLCNREIKFGPFKKYAMDLGADYVATGHYCDIKHDGNNHYLMRCLDENKDQTYFLNQVTNEQLSNVIFPLANIIKNDVRKMAIERNIPVAKKKDSTGICFIGERDFRGFLSKYIPMKQGNIITEDGTIIGKHNGVYFYTIGQRRGLGIGGVKNGNDERWFVLQKDVEKNLLIVSQGEEEILYKNTLVTEGFNFIPTRPEDTEFRCLARIRHRQPLQEATAYVEGDNVRVVFDEKQRAIVEGQYCVLYKDKYCLGGGVISKVFNS